MNTERFKDMCQTSFSICTNQKSNDTYDNFDQKFEYALNAFKQSKTPIYNPRQGQWSQTETNLLISIIKEGFKIGSILNDHGDIKWEVVSEYMLGRDATSCKNKWFKLKREKDQRIIGISKEDNFSVAYKKNPYFNKIFSKEQEDTLFFNIKAMLDEHQLVTMNTISSIAKDLYYSPIFLATKAREIEDSQNKKNKTTFNELLNMATDEPEQLMNKYDIRQFVASKSWVFHYMVRHNLSLRKVHYERRGQIDEKQIDRYLNQIVEAVTEFGTDKIINMDETHVSTWNFPQRV